MALSLLGCAQGIRDLLTERSEAVAGVSVPMIAGHIPTVLEAFAREIALNPAKRDLLRKDFSNTIANGIANLTANIAAGLLLEHFLTWEITLDDDPDFPPFHMIAEPSQLRFRRPGEHMFITAVAKGSTLYTRDTEGARDADLGDITIRGSFLPVIAEDAANTTLPAVLHGEVQHFGARFILGNTNGRK